MGKKEDKKRIILSKLKIRLNLSVFGKKKGLESYISWVLLLGLTVALSVFMFSWINSHAESSVEDMEERADTSACDDAGLSLKGICQNTQTLNMNITNIRELAISRINFRFFDLYDNQDSRSLNITIRPGDTERIEIIKQGTLKQAEIIPVITLENSIITCKKSMITAENIAIC